MPKVASQIPEVSPMVLLDFDNGTDCAHFIEKLFEEHGDINYGEGITQTEHALQSAMHLDRLGHDDATVVAGLLHDVGHLIHAEKIYHAEFGIDDVHETAGAEFLSRFFPPSVTEPVRLHVDAKRYLCARQPGYFDRLSEASVLSLKLQGGPMTEEEATAFEMLPYLEESLALRRCDEAAKVPNLKTPGFEQYFSRIEALFQK